jgi:hypothetical protein
VFRGANTVGETDGVCWGGVGVDARGRRTGFAVGVQLAIVPVIVPAALRIPRLTAACSAHSRHSGSRPELLSTFVRST